MTVQKLKSLAQRLYKADPLVMTISYSSQKVCENMILGSVLAVGFILKSHSNISELEVTFAGKISL